MSALKICPTCSVVYPESERFCPKDGAALHWQSGVTTDLVGSIIAERYHVQKQLGAGGMGRVYLAEHVKMGRQSAIKVLHPAMAGDAEAIGRFNREAANASRIDHPNVAAIYDFGETHDGLLYLAMQYVEGQTLTQIMKATGALPPLRARDRWEPGVPTRIHIGALDDWTPAKPCIELGEAMAARGEPLKVTVYPDSHHGFDAPNGDVVYRTDVPNGVNPGQGVHVGANPAAREMANAKVRAFLNERLRGIDDSKAH